MRIAALILLLLTTACADPTSRHLGRDAEPLGGNLYRAEGRGSDLLVLDGRIDRATVATFDALVADPSIEVRGLMVAASQGGDRARAAQLAQKIRARNMNTAVLGACFASCVDVFLAGGTRGMARDAVLGIPIVRGRFASYALAQIPPSAIEGPTLDDAGGSFRLISQSEAFRLGLATDIFE